MAKMGRPRIERPKQNRVQFRLDDFEYERLKSYASRHNKTISQILLLGMYELYEKEAKVK